MGSEGVDVLVVEDEESFIDALTLALPRSGFHVRVARSGLEALRMFAEVRPSLILLDVMIPDVSGVDVCRMIRAESDVPIIMVTARAEDVDIAIGLEAGADVYVTKPYRVRSLVEQMRVLLESRQAQ